MYIVFMESELYGRETFPRETLAQALETIRNLVMKVEADNDGIERQIGLIVNKAKEWNIVHKETGEILNPEPFDNYDSVVGWLDKVYEETPDDLEIEGIAKDEWEIEEYDPE